MKKEFIKNDVKYTFEREFIHFSGVKMYVYNKTYIINDNKLGKIIVTDEELNILTDALENNNYKYNQGTKFTDGFREFEVIEYMERHKMYRLKNYTDNREDELMKEDRIDSYINNKERFENILEENKQYAIKMQQLEEEEKRKEEQQRMEYEFCYGFVDNKTAMQKGKILKTLNKGMSYQHKYYTVKGFIEYIVKTYPDLITKSYLNTNRYSKKKINGCYEKLVDKMEYEIWWIEDGKKTGVNLDTKTEYEYCNYLLNNIDLLTA